ncbi:MAG TPA: hypothetical protein VGC22_03095 [Chitinophaga sp.]
MLVMLSCSALAQQQSRPGIDSVRLHYEKMATPYLYNGFEYVHYDQHIYNNLDPYFRSRAYGVGDIWYQGRHFADQRMILDIVLEQLVIPNDYLPGTYGQLVLLHDRVDSFSLHGLRFIHMRDSTQYRPGFYARLHKGRTTTLYARYVKDLEKGKITPDGIWDAITDHNYYEMEVAGQFHVVHTQADISRLLGQKRKVVKRYLRNQDIEFKRERERAIVAVVRHFDPQ